VVEAVGPAESEARVVCLDGERAGPPEDTGGIVGYTNMLTSLDDYVDIVGEDFDPAAVDLGAINTELAGVRRSGGR
jgi:hypothetical protein